MFVLALVQTGHLNHDPRDLGQRLNKIHIIQGNFPFFGRIGPDGPNGLITDQDGYGKNGGNSLSRSVPISTVVALMKAVV